MAFSILGDCASAFTLLSRIPVFWFRFENQKVPDFTRSLWAFPIVGLAIGAMAGCLLLPTVNSFLPPIGAAILALGLIVLTTGALHEDGLADMIDGFGGGHTADDKSRIMHDSRIGSYGVLVLVLVNLFRIFLFHAVSTKFTDALSVVFFMAITLAAARGQIIFQLYLFPISPYAKLGTVLSRPTKFVGLAATALWAIPLICLFPLIPALGAAFGAVLAALGIGYLAKRQLAGLTGDIMGASIIAAEIGFMTFFYAAITSVFSGFNA